MKFPVYFGEYIVLSSKELKDLAQRLIGLSKGFVLEATDQELVVILNQRGFRTPTSE